MKTITINCHCTKDKTIKLESGHQVCSHCEYWKEECLEREKLARSILSMPRAQGAREYTNLRNSGMNMTKLDNVIKRIKNVD